MKKIERSKFCIVTTIASLLVYLLAFISAVTSENQWLLLGLVLCGAMLALIVNNVSEGWEAFGIVKNDPEPDWEELEEMIRKKMGK